MELSERTSGWVILVNDSKKSIEAFHVSVECEISEAKGGGGTQYTYDSLQSPGSRHSSPSFGGKIVLQDDVIAPKGQLISSTRLSPQPSGCERKADITAVIYSDGSYEGDEMAARAIQAQRDGTADGVRYWADRFHRESAHAPVDAVIDQANMFSQVANSHGGCNGASLACEYWTGRRFVDLNVANWLEGSKQSTADHRYKQTVELIEAWQRKIDTDSALKKMDITFSLPTALTEQIVQWNKIQEKITVLTAKQ
jgi:hypothetical protein